MARAMRVAWVVVAALVVSAGLGGPGPATAQSTSFSPGSSGGGDPYFPLQGNGGYDVRHYDVVFSYDPATKRMAGTTHVTAVATQNLSRLNLDFTGLVVRAVRVNRGAATFIHQGQELTVTPSTGLVSGQTFVVSVVYDGDPSHVVDPDNSIEGWIDTDDGAYVAGAPQGAMTWFPGNHDLRDKATHTIRVTVPDGTTAVANGDLTSTTSAGGQTTFVWTSSEPMVDYLATATIGRFNVTRTTTSTGPNYIAIDPTTSTGPTNSVHRTPEIVSSLSALFGPYPFSVTGGIVDNASFVGYALETQTKPLYPIPPFLDLVVHELAHQWYGDSLTPASWRDVWLNEGFATYAEWLWIERAGGATAQARFDQEYASRPSGDAFWQVLPGDPGPPALFHPAVYDRGAMTLQALRRTVGNRAFFYILRTWADENRYGTVTTPQFVDLAERLSGRQLDDLFQRWLYTPGKPSFP
ncbi:MAG TPA: M1 family metallopeptidase [Acidimicrobiales bacterium]|nr:M1 family metallopeptidase [Acidimicrobiales bacterium]